MHTPSGCGGCWCGGCWCGGCRCTRRRSAHTLAPDSVAVQPIHTLRDRGWGTGVSLALAVLRRVLALRVDDVGALAKSLVSDLDCALQALFAL
jgi:hypothetical protein